MPSLRRIAFLLVVLGACGDAPPPDVLLVTIDTLRADRVYPHDADGRRAPFLAQLGREGTSFRRAYSTTSWTAPAIVSLLTGTSPARHGVEHGARFAGNVVGQEQVPADLALLPELLRERGYRTFGIAANGHLAAEFGLGRGFERYRCLGFVDAPAVLALFDEWAADIRTSAPYFLWVHLLDPHAPYGRRDPWRSAALGERPRRPELEGVQPAVGYAQRGVRAGTPELAYVEALYDADVASVDAAVRHIVERLAPGAEDLIIVTADHGEEFLEHGGFGHGATLYEERIRVPLIVRFPGRRGSGRVVETPVSLVDVLPTVLAEVGMAAPGQAEGVALGRGRGDPSRRLFAELARGRESAAVVDGASKWIRQDTPVPARLLFDLTADPGERTNLEVGVPAEAARLDRLLREHRTAQRAARRGAPRVQRLDGQQVEQLRALGYLE